MAPSKSRYLRTADVGHDASRNLRSETASDLGALLTPVFVNEGERQHGLAEAVAEYDRLLIAYHELGYETVVLRKVGVADRADSMLSYIG